MVALIAVPIVAMLAFTLYDRGGAANAPGPAMAVAPAAPAPASPAPVAPMPGRRPVTVALSQWPGHLALVVANGGLTTQPGSAADAEGLNLNIVFIEDAPSKNKALRRR